MRTISICTALLLSLATYAQAAPVPLYDERIQYQGRWNHDTVDQPSASYAGSHINVGFTGSEASITVGVKDKPEQFRLIVNGVANDSAIEFAPGEHRLTLFKGPHGTHRVTLYKETMYGGAVQLSNLDIDGELNQLDALPTHRIAFFGDSNMDGTSLYSDADSGHSGMYYAYPATVGRMLNAQTSIQSLGGATLAGEGPNTVASMVYSRDFYSHDKQYRDDFSPQVIVVNAGANDIGKTDQAGVKARYREAITNIRDAYGDQPHIVLYNAYGWDYQEPANYSHEIAHEVGGKISVLLFPWTWDKWHGSMVEQAGQARILANHIVSLGLGFELNQDAEIFNRFSGTFDVANGSFEAVAKAGFNSFGWRYVDQDSVRIKGDAADGDYYVRLSNGKRIHQGNDATGDLKPGGTQGKQRYRVSAMARSNNGGTLNIGAAFQDQHFASEYPSQLKSFRLTGEWQPVTTQVTAPEGSWKIQTILQASKGSVDIDAVRVEAISHDTSFDLLPMDRLTLNWGGYDREAFIYIPESAPRKAPLVVAIHGYTSTATGFQVAHGLNRHARDNGYAVLYPQGMHFKADWGGRVTSWNDEAANLATDKGKDAHCAAEHDPYPMPPDCKVIGPCGWTTCQDDVGYINALLDLTLANAALDKTRVYALGVSNGAMMTLRLGCNIGHRFAAIAPIIGQLAPEFDCASKTPLPMIHLAGAKDTTVTIDGSKTQDGYFYNSVAETTLTWANANRCTLDTKPWDNRIASNGGMTCAKYDNCGTLGSAVASCIDPNETHNWPAQGYLGAPATCVTAQQADTMPEQPLCHAPSSAYRSAGMDTIWAFFNQYKVGD